MLKTNVFRLLLKNKVNCIDINRIYTEPKGIFEYNHPEYNHPEYNHPEYNPPEYNYPEYYSSFFLSKAEKQYLKLLNKGMTPHQMSIITGAPVKRIYNRRSQLIRKLGVRNEHVLIILLPALLAFDLIP